MIVPKVTVALEGSMALTSATQLYYINTINSGHNIFQQNGLLQVFIGHINTITPRVLIFYQG